MRSMFLASVLAIGCSGSEAAPADPGSADTGVANADATSADAAADASGADTITADAFTEDTFTETAPDAGCAHDGPDVWAWNPNIVTDATERAAFFAFADSKKVRAVYVESEGLVSSTSSAAQLGTFVAEAKTHCIHVEALFGYAQWAFTANHAAAVALASKANGLGLPAHFDVEPYSLPEWTSDQNGTANQLLDLYEKLAATGVRLSVDSPFWFDTIQVTRAGAMRPLSELVLDRVDVMTIMDYRDKAEPPDGIIDNAQSEMTYAAKVGKHVVIGVETTCGLDPMKVTFCEEGEAAMMTALATTKATYGASSAFGGFAVHDYAAWKVLKP